MQHSGLTSFFMTSRQMQDLVNLGLTSGCKDDRGTLDETTRWFMWVPCDVVARQCWCVLANSCSLARVFGYFLHQKTLSSLCTQMVLFTLVMQHSGLTSFVMASRQIQDLVKHGSTIGCQDDRGNVDVTTRWFVWVPCDVVARKCWCASANSCSLARVFGYLLDQKTLISLCTRNKWFYLL
jgi:hypothetical protein